MSVKLIPSLPGDHLGSGIDDKRPAFPGHDAAHCQGRILAAVTARTDTLSTGTQRYRLFITE